LRWLITIRIQPDVSMTWINAGFVRFERVDTGKITQG